MIPSIAVIGAGAAGLMAAIHATGPGRRVILLERTRDGGRKILISGGGRCNLLPSKVETERYVTSSSPALLKRLLRIWPLTEQRRFFEEVLQLPLVMEPETGKLFPVANRAREVRDKLVQEVIHRGATWRPGVEVNQLEPIQGRWRIGLTEGAPIDVDKVILTTGGLSVPQTGSDGFGLDVLRRMGHNIRPVYPALTPLTLTPAVHAQLAGVSLPVTIRGRWGKERRTISGSLLFTHRGYSGPAVLNISDLAARSSLPGNHGPAELRVSWGTLDVADWERILVQPGTTLSHRIRESLPQRLADYLIREVGLEPDQQLAQLRRDQRRLLTAALGDYHLRWTGDEGYRKAEVTGGGVALDEIDSRTMESRIAPGLFLAGELLDAFGQIGGYNFFWAWATGRQAGRGAAQLVSTSTIAP